jgi:hypothetical protein
MIKWIKYGGKHTWPVQALPGQVKKNAKKPPKTQVPPRDLPSMNQNAKPLQVKIGYTSTNGTCV